MEFLTNDITDYQIFVYAGMSICIAFIATILALFVFRAITSEEEGQHDFEPLDAPIPKSVTWATVQRYPELRKEAYQLLCEAISQKLDKNITGEHIPYATMKLKSYHFEPNDKTDSNDILFSILALQTIKIVVEVNREKYIEYLKGKLPNYGENL